MTVEAKLLDKMSGRQRLLLRLIAVEFHKHRFWMPRADTQYVCDGLGNESVDVSGPGDAAILRGFASKGLVKFNASQLSKYACEIQPLGLAVIEEMRRRAHGL